MYILAQQKQFDFATHSDYNRKGGDYTFECGLFLFKSSCYYQQNYPQTLTAPRECCCVVVKLLCSLAIILLAKKVDAS